MEIGAEAEVRCVAAIQDRRLAGAFAVVVDVLSDVHNTFIFGANFQGGRGDNLRFNLEKLPKFAFYREFLL